MVKITLNIGDRVVLRGGSYRRNSEIVLKLKKIKKQYHNCINRKKDVTRYNY